MNNLLMRDFHECLGEVIKVDMNEDIRLGNYYMDKIPFNMVKEVEEENKKKIENPLLVSDDECLELIYRCGFTMPDDNRNYVEKLFIEAKDYWRLYYYYINNVDVYKKMDKFNVYSFCRNMCGKPISATEHKKIRDDLKSIKKSMNLLRKKKMNKKNGDFTVDF
tara:strand:- start:3513 stop:4004 length:492 start_codon:yes stop_codon:yes gene_type:complete